MYSIKKVEKFEYSVYVFRVVPITNVTNSLQGEGFIFNGIVGSNSIYIKSEFASVFLEIENGIKTFIKEYNMLGEVKRYFNTTENITKQQFEDFNNDIQSGKIKFVLISEGANCKIIY